jgi:hypothetical protein
VIQTPERGARIMRYELADFEWTAIKPMLPNKPRGVPRVNDRRVLNGIFWILRSGAPWRDCRRRLAHTPLATTASSGGGGPVFGAASSAVLIMAIGYQIADDSEPGFRVQPSG